MARIVRTVVFLTLSISIASITLPAQAEFSAHHQHKCCCASDAPAADDHGKIDNHCNQPVQSQDRQCCSACPLGFALIANTAQRFVFPKRDGQNLRDDVIATLTRADRPPVPPPRA